MFLFLIRLLISSFVLIFLSYVGPNILLNIRLSVINNFCLIHSFSTHVSLEYVITGLIVVQYNVNFKNMMAKHYL